KIDFRNLQALPVPLQDSVYLNGKSGNHQKRRQTNPAEGENIFIPAVGIKFSVYSIGIGTHHQQKSQDCKSQTYEHPSVVFLTKVKWTLGFVFGRTERVSGEFCCFLCHFKYSINRRY